MREPVTAVALHRGRPRHGQLVEQPGGFGGRWTGFGGSWTGRTGFNRDATGGKGEDDGGGQDIEEDAGGTHVLIVRPDRHPGQNPRFLRRVSGGP
ncbi:hypothetical protein Ais01nite_32170 [Asanoa ishikariensis]|nr:hypothetical protein Ais01nite_32170 [Asanoa ishikariensis]